MEFSRQDYWSGLPCPSPGDLPNPGIKSVSPALQEDSLPSEPPRKPLHKKVTNKNKPDSYWNYSFCSKICALFSMLSQAGSAVLSPQIVKQLYLEPEIWASKMILW